MKTNHKLIGLCLSLLTLSGFSMQESEASAATYTGAVDLSITITSIINESNPGAGYGNDLFYSGLIAQDPLSESIIDGEGEVTPTFSGDPLLENPTVLPVNFSFNQGMKIAGNAIDGSIDSYYFGFADLILENTSEDTYKINYSVDYSLSVITTTSSNLDFSEATVSISGENLGLPNDYAEVYSNALIAVSDELSDKNELVLTLVSGEDAAFFSALEFSGYAEASPVPVPGALGLLLTALLVLPRFYKTKK